MSTKIPSVDLEIEEDESGNVRFQFVLSEEQARQYFRMGRKVGKESTADFFALEEVIPETKFREQKDLDTIRSTGLSNYLISNISQTVLGVKGVECDHKGLNHNLTEMYPIINDKAATWWMRPITERCIALYVAPFELPIGMQKGKITAPMLAVLGLTTENKQVILTVSEATEEDAAKMFKDVIDRGLDSSKIKLGVIGLSKPIGGAFRKAFPNADIQICLLEMTKYLDTSFRDEFRKFLYAKDIKAFKLVHTKSPDRLKKELAPFLKNLVMYFKFDPKLHRALKTINSINRLKNKLHREYNQSLKRGVSDQGTLEIIKTWVSLRFHYQWWRIPVDAPQLNNLEYMKDESDKDSD